MFEFTEIEEVKEIDELYRNTNTSGYKYTENEIWQMGKAAIEELFKANAPDIFKFEED